MFLEFFSVDTIFFTLLGYPMSYLEFFGTVFTAISVYLAGRNKIETWIISIIGVILYSFLFYQLSLYSDLLEQMYYFVIAFWGWYLWLDLKKKKIGKKKKELHISTTNFKWNFIAVVSIVILSISLGVFMTKIHLILPVMFPVKASFPYLDAFTTVMSFVATAYLAKRKIENWYLWIIVDVIGIWLYWEKGVGFLSLLYFVFLINAIFGLVNWNKRLQE